MNVCKNERRYLRISSGKKIKKKRRFDGLNKLDENLFLNEREKFFFFRPPHTGGPIPLFIFFEACAFRLWFPMEALFLSL